MVFVKPHQCLLKNIFTKIHKPTSPSQRFKKSSFLIKSPKIFKYFKVFLKNFSGRNNSGTVTITSKGRSFKKNVTPIVRPIIFDKRLSVLISIFRRKKKCIAMHKHITGSFSIRPLVFGSKINHKNFSSNLPQKF